MGMALVSSPERWDELGGAETRNAAGGPCGKGLRAPGAPWRAGGRNPGERGVML